MKRKPRQSSATSPQVAGELRVLREPLTPGRIAKACFVNVALAVLVGAALLPVIGPLALATREATAYYDALPDTLPPIILPQRSVILAADGSVIANFYSENRVLVHLTDVPQVMRDAIVNIEDSRFYQHGGVDFKGTARAIIHNARSSTTQGGSTLTQQYVKNVLLANATTDAQRQEVTGQSYTRKIKEAKLAIKFDQTHTKDQTLEAYLNIAYFGDGAYGVGTAAQHYFGKNIKNVTLPEAAMLAGLVQNPSGFNPTQHPVAALTRRNIVLLRMQTLNSITLAQERAARAMPVSLKITTPQNGCTASPFPFYCGWVRQTLESDPAFGATSEARAAFLFQGGLTIRTALQPAAQKVAEAAVRAAIPTSSRIAVAAVTVQPGTGNVISMAVNRDFGSGPGKTQMLLPAIAAYQPGSTMKTVTLATALERGTPLNTVMDAPVAYSPDGMNSPDGGFTNAGDSEAGTYDLAQATWRSVNTWYIELEEKVGVLNVADMAARLGITSIPRTGSRAITKADASLTLGAFEVSPLEMAGVYATFAAHGVACRPTGITAVTRMTAGVKVALPKPDPKCHQAISPGVADTVTSILQGVIDGPDPLRTGVDASIGRPAAGKTGTTDGSAAVWFNGYTPQLATAVWVGDPSGGQAHPLLNITANGQQYDTAFGGPVAGPIWAAIMKPLSAALPVEPFRPADPNVINGYGTATPDVRGLTPDRAVQVLQDAGFTVTLASGTAAPEPLVSAGQVVGQRPAPNTATNYAATITLTLSAGSNTNLRVPAHPTPVK